MPVIKATDAPSASVHKAQVVALNIYPLKGASALEIEGHEIVGWQLKPDGSLVGDRMLAVVREMSSSGAKK